MIAIFQSGSDRTSGMKRTRRSITALLATLLIVLQFGASSTAAQVSGNTYTSPQFGYEVSWDDSWFVMLEETEPPYWDHLALTNGITTVNLFGETNVYATFESGLATYLSISLADPGISDFAPMLDDEGNSIRASTENGALAAFTFTYTFENGVTIQGATYIQVCGLDGGSVLFGYSAIMPLEMFETEYALDGVTLPCRASVPTADPAPNPNSIGGEPAPVFVSGYWRIAVATSAVQRTFPDLGLKQKTNKDWLITVLDVTNWSDQDATLAAADFTIKTEAGQKPAKIARRSIGTLAELLGTAQFADGLKMQVGAGETVRIVLAFVIPIESDSPMLAHGSMTMPLNGTITPDFVIDELPVPNEPPAFDEGEIVSASDGQTMRVLLDGEEESVRIRLLGVDPPKESPCYLNAAEKLLDDLVGARVLVEEDAQITGGSIPGRYVWLINDDGTRTLINQQLIADGWAFAAELPAVARFGAWIQEAERTAEIAEVGIWSSCPRTDSDPEATQATPVGVPKGRD